MGLHPPAEMLLHVVWQRRTRADHELGLAGQLEQGAVEWEMIQVPAQALLWLPHQHAGWAAQHGLHMSMSFQGGEEKDSM